MESESFPRKLEASDVLLKRPKGYTRHQRRGTLFVRKVLAGINRSAPLVSHWAVELLRVQFLHRGQDLWSHCYSWRDTLSKELPRQFIQCVAKLPHHHECTPKLQTAQLWPMVLQNRKIVKEKTTRKHLGRK